jgi:phosphate transport system permease protein
LSIAVFSVLQVAYVVFSIARVAMLAIHTYGISVLTTTTWDPNKAQFGVLPAIVGTVYSSILGLIGGTFFGLAIAIFALDENLFLAPGRIE